jgi:hypothetical protein
VYTTVPPAQKVAPNRFIHKSDRANVGKSNRNSAAWLSDLTLAANAVLDAHCCPTALWSLDRAECLFNSPTVELFGFQDNDVCADPKLWVARIDERDRDAFITSWQRLQNGESKIVCRYRFNPPDASAAVEIVEDALLLPHGSGDKSAVLSRYQAYRPALRKPGRNDLRVEELLHQIANYLQGIHGEADLLRLFNGLPQRSFDTITQSIDCIQNLLVQIDPAAGPLTFEPRSSDEIQQGLDPDADK